MTEADREETLLDVQLITLDEEDDIVSIQDRLDWSEKDQVALVLPETGDVLIEYLDLALLRRHADARRLEVGLVTTDGRVIGQARALGFAIFSSTELAESSQRLWWRGRGRKETIGRGRQLDEEDRQEVRERRQPRSFRQRWVARYLAILLFFLTVSVLFTAAAYVVPGATVVLKPQVETVSVSQQIVADPELESVSFSGASVPGRLLRAEQEWQAGVETTGTIEVPDAPARGKVIFANQVDTAVTAPAGTRVSTTAGTRIVFQTIASAEVPGVVGGTVEVDVVAVEPGPAGNVEVNQINRVEGPLALQLEVRNLEAMTGGGVRLAPAVTVADQERLRAQVLQQLQVLALGEMETMLTGQEFLARDSLQVVEVLHETYSHFPGEPAERLTLEIRAALQATAVDESQATGLVYEALAAAVRPGYSLAPNTIQFRSGEVVGVDNQGRVTFRMNGEGKMAAQLKVAEELPRIAGQETRLAMAYLFENLALREMPSARVWPNWFGRMPYLTVRIQTELKVED